MIDYYNRKLILEDGEEYLGSAFGYIGEKVLELVFNTSMVGHQEILSDPSYTCLLYTSQGKCCSRGATCICTRLRAAQWGPAA